MKTALIYGAGAFLLITLLLKLGTLEVNYFAATGFSLTIISSAITIIISWRNGLRALRAERIEFEPSPAEERRESHFFKFPGTIMKNGDRLKCVEDSVKEIQNIMIQDERTMRSLIAFTNRRIDICIDRLNYHEDVTLPKALGSQSGLVVASGLLAIVGAVILFQPEEVYTATSNAAIGLEHLFQSFANWLSKL